MTSYPLPTLSPTVDAAGITTLSLADIYSSLQASFRKIYGADIYIDSDTQDGQWLGILARAIYDAGLRAQDVYNAYSPTTAQGAGLASIVKTNGLNKKIPTRSTVGVDIVGQANLQILGGVVSDEFDTNQWTLPSVVNIPLAGTISVTATCLTTGAVIAPPHSINTIITPQPGWQTVDNPLVSIAGQPVESDAALRRRQARSTAFPARTIREAIYAQVAAINSVVRAQVYQNDNDHPDMNGMPGHSIAVITEGGDSFDIATVIARVKPPGTGTYGTVTEVVYDQNGVPDTINFRPLEDVNIFVMLFIRPLPNFTTNTENMLLRCVATYLNNLDIGEYSFGGRFNAPAGLVGEDAQQATGLKQPQLDLLADTYDVEEVAQARFSMQSVGNVLETEIVIPLMDSTNYKVGNVVYMRLDDTSLFSARVIHVDLYQITIYPAIPTSRTLINASLVFVVGNVKIDFYEAAHGDIANMSILIRDD